jgi:hypothetical protein
MKLWLVICGTVWLSSLAMFAFMIAGFAGGGAANSGKLGTWGMRFVTVALLLLPGLCILALSMLWVAYSREWGVWHYWWNAFPLPFIVGYFFVLSWLSKS